MKLLSLFFTLLFITQLAAAESVCYQSHQPVNYTLEQGVDLIIKVNKEQTTKIHADGKLEFEIQLLNQEGNALRYPIEVQLILKRVILSEEKSFHYGYESLNFDSNTKTPRDRLRYLLLAVRKLLNKPLVFSISEDQQVTEMTGLFQEFQEKLDSHDDILPILDFNTFELFVTYLFHPANQSVQEGKSFAFNVYPLLNLCLEPDEKIDPQNPKTVINESGKYQIQSISGNHLSGHLKGQTRVQVSKPSYKGTASINGQFDCNTENVLIQQRQQTFKLNAQGKKEGLNYTCSATVDETWTSH